MNIQRDEKGKLLLTLIKVQQQISSTCTKDQLHCDNTINKEYLVSDATIRLSKEDVNCCIIFFFSKKKNCQLPLLPLCIIHSGWQGKHSKEKSLASSHKYT